jgi:hypothetical protein
MSTWRRHASLLIGLTAALAIAGCQSSSGSPASPSGQQRDAAQRYVSCMKDSGWSEESAGGLDHRQSARPMDPKYDTDMQRCRSESGMDKELPEEGAQNDPQKQNEGTLAFVQCMRDRGWQIDDPKPDAQGVLRPPAELGSVPPDKKEAFKADLTACSAGNMGPPNTAGHEGPSVPATR